jgi:DNA-directed RNA polymerase subunit delta
MYGLDYILIRRDYMDLELAIRLKDDEVDEDEEWEEEDDEEWDEEEDEDLLDEDDEDLDEEDE